jgi:hypothetical protein
MVAANQNIDRYAGYVDERWWRLGTLCSKDAIVDVLFFGVRHIRANAENKRRIDDRRILQRALIQPIRNRLVIVIWHDRSRPEKSIVNRRCNIERRKAKAKVDEFVIVVRDNRARTENANISRRWCIV